jgi:hypothetical protein
MKLCVIFDIDETLIHFIDERNYHVWENTSEKHKKMLDYEEDKINRKVCIFRPLIQEMFSFFMKNQSMISVGLWTYADAKYASEIREIIIKLCNLPKDFFLFTYSVDDISGHYPKDLRHVYSNFPEFNKSNTFLVDNLASNVMHDINKQNGIVVPSFAPYGFNTNPDPTKNGEDEFRLHATALDHAKARRDHSLRDVVFICKKISEPDKGDHVFSTDRVREMGLQSFFELNKKVSMKYITSMPASSRSNRSSATATFTQAQNTMRKNNANKAIKALTAEQTDLAGKQKECEKKVAAMIKLHGKKESHMYTNQENYKIDECKKKSKQISEKIKALQKTASRAYDIKGGCPCNKKSGKRKTMKAWKFW